jgi:hypothetical protein
MNGNFKSLFSKILLKPSLILFFIVGIGIVLRLYNINWGAPYYFHPDERNIASSVSQLYLTKNLNPHFFAYGSLPIYLVYLLSVFVNLVSYFFTATGDVLSVSFETAIIIGRLVSSIFSVLTIYLMYLVSKQYVSEKFSVLCALLSSVSIGLIQYAHYGTFESHLTFFSLLLFYFCIQYLKYKKFSYFMYASIIVGVLVSLKISSLVLVPLPWFVLVHLSKKHFITGTFFKKFSILIKFLFIALLEVFIVLSLFLLLNPFAVLDFKAFVSSIQYESSVGTGALPVFYTGSFYNTTPIWYQITHVFPYLLNPVNYLLIIFSFLFLLITTFKEKNIKFFFLLIFIFFLLIPQAILFVKWTRYMIPTLPFLYILLAYSLYNLYLFSKKQNKKILNIYKVSVYCVVIISTFYATLFIKTVYGKPDTRIQAATYASRNLPSTSKILSETYDLGIIPFNSYFETITLFDFYDLDNDIQKKEELKTVLNNHDYFIIISQRVQKSRLQNPDHFPEGHAFYSKVTQNKNFDLVYSTPCDIWCKIIYIGDPVYRIEDTANVFDRPQVSIYKIK